MSKNFFFNAVLFSSNILLGQARTFFVKDLGPDSCCVYKDSFFFSCICAQKIFTCNLHTYACHLWKIEVILTKSFGVNYFRFVTTDARRLQNLILFSRVEQLFCRAPYIFSKQKFLQPKFTRIIFGSLCIPPENLNSIHQELCELITFESSNRTLFPPHRTNCLCAWLPTRSFGFSSCWVRRNNF